MYHGCVIKVYLIVCLLTVGTDYRSRQVTPVTFPPGPPAEMEVCFDTISDDVIECNETFKLSFIVSDTFDDVVEIDPDFSEADVTIIDDDGRVKDSNTLFKCDFM